LKLLVVASSLDLRAPLGVTPSLWQLLKALAERGVELVVAPYQGPAIESPWWTAAVNPCEREGNAVGWLKRLAPGRGDSSSTGQDPVSDRLTRALVERFTKPRWRQHLVRLIQKHRDFDALLFLAVPANHFGGIPTLIDKHFGLPTYLYDGDVPASLPRFDGFRTGFRIYQGANLGEYEAVLSNSVGGLADLKALGARRAYALHYAADPSLLRPHSVQQDIDVFFYGHGAEYREHWIDAMLRQPAARLSALQFAVRGGRLGLLPGIAQLPYLSFAKLSGYCARSRINLLITREAHASVYGSSTARIFELAALGCAMVSNPYAGVQEWFEPGQEILLVANAQEAMDAYTRLLADEAWRRRLGELARNRLLAEHTYAHRAAQLCSFLN
jgi:glycosyltransferase involved in cell wall biosynthesis